MKIVFGNNLFCDTKTKKFPLFSCIVQGATHLDAILCTKTEDGQARTTRYFIFRVSSFKYVNSKRVDE